jgi:hypothetical protein
MGSIVTVLLIHGRLEVECGWVPNRTRSTRSVRVGCVGL